MNPTACTRTIPEPFAHQLEAMEFIKELEYSALFMEQGTGKSKVGLMKAHHLMKKGSIDRLLIISPNAVKDQWVDEQVPLHFPGEFYKSIVWDGFNTKTSKNSFAELLDYHGFKIFSLNIEAFSSSSADQYIKMFYKEDSTMVIIDESTRIKNGSRKPAGGRRVKRKGAISTNKILDLFERCRYKMIMTGTPTPNSPMDLWSQFEFLKKDYFGMDSFYFYHRYCITRTEVFNGRRVSVPIDEKTYAKVKSRLSKEEKLTAGLVEECSALFGIKTSDVISIHKSQEFTPYKNLEELRGFINKVTFTKRKSECLDLPEKLYSRLLVDLSPEEKRVYKDLKSKMYAEYEGKEINVTTKMVMALRLQMVTGGLFPYDDTKIRIEEDGEYYEKSFSNTPIIGGSKVKVLISDLEEVPGDVSVIVWARFTGEINMIHQKLVDSGYSAEKYYGGSHISIIDRFKAREFRILVANPLKGGEGLNLQVSTLQYFYSNSFMGDKRLQAEDRSHRMGQRNPVLYKDIVCRGTVDERILEVLQRKGNLIDYFRSNPMWEPEVGF